MGIIFIPEFYLLGKGYIEKVGVSMGMTLDEIRETWRNFKFKRGSFLFIDVNNDTDPIAYWENFLGRPGVSKFARVALKILRFPQSSASVERSFSPIRIIHTRLRNRLGRDTLAKLVYVYYNVRALNIGEYDFR